MVAKVARWLGALGWLAWWLGAACRQRWQSDKGVLRRVAAPRC